MQTTKIWTPSKVQGFKSQQNSYIELSCQHILKQKYMSFFAHYQTLIVTKTRMGVTHDEYQTANVAKQIQAE